MLSISVTFFTKKVAASIAVLWCSILTAADQISTWGAPLKLDFYPYHSTCSLLSVSEKITFQNILAKRKSHEASVHAQYKNAAARPRAQKSYHPSGISTMDFSYARIVCSRVAAPMRPACQRAVTATHQCALRK